jgi:hypothetical protein
MDSPNRINPTSMTLTVKRQTPKNEFGQVLANTLTGAVKTGSAIVGALGGGPIVSAAVSSISSVTGQISAAASGPVQARQGATGVVTLGGGGSGGIGSVGGTVQSFGTTSAGSAPGSLAGETTTYSNPDVQQMAQMSDYYLHLQNEMQAESREYNAVSNIIKVRHDSAKAAINNIR